MLITLSQDVDKHALKFMIETSAGKSHSCNGRPTISTADYPIRQDDRNFWRQAPDIYFKSVLQMFCGPCLRGAHAVVTRQLNGADAYCLSPIIIYYQ